VTDVPADVLEAAQRIRFAGLGAMALAQEEGTKLVENSGKLFSVLIEKGEEMEKSGLSPIAPVKSATQTAESTWTRIQALLDAQVSAALSRLGVPTKDEIAELTRRIELLTASIETLRAQQG
jgi:poly(hydroxyalkanoate) granule-associated protein